MSPFGQDGFAILRAEFIFDEFTEMAVLPQSGDSPMSPKADQLVAIGHHEIIPEEDRPPPDNR